MIVGMWMSRKLVAIEPTTPIGTAAKLMADNSIRRLPVVRREGEDDMHLLGLVSATDLYRAFPAHVNPFSAESLAKDVDGMVMAQQIMSRDVLTTAPDTPIEDAASIMRDRKIGALPVTSGGRLIGLITESDIFKAFISILRGDESGSRVTFTISNSEDVFGFLAQTIRRRDVHVLSLMSSRGDRQTSCVVRFSGPEVDQTIEDLWKSGHQVLNVLQKR